MNEYYRDEEMETVHIYVLRENVPPVIDAEPLQEEPQPQQNRWGMTYCSCIGVIFTLIPFVAILAASLLPPYDAVLNKTLSLTLSLHPAPSQVQLNQLPAITKMRKATVLATGKIQEPATRADGLITFYNGLFTSQTIPAGTVLTGKDGINIVTSSQALIPAATPTTPPTYGTVSVMARSELPGTAGDIAASDIDQACCGPSILAQNLDAFSGGTNAQEVTVVMQSDLINATALLKNALDQETHDQAQSEQKAWQQLLPLQCPTSTNASHQAGDQAQEVTVTVSTQCLPLAYTVASVQQQAMSVLSHTLPHTYQLLRMSMILLDATGVDAHTGTATLTVHLTAFLQMIHPLRNRWPYLLLKFERYRFIMDFKEI